MSNAVPPTIQDEPDELTAKQRAMIVGALVVLVVLILAAIFLIRWMVLNPATTENIRDIFIIFMAFEASLIGLALTILIIQIARLTALIENEIKPMLEATQETLNTVRGTSQFLSRNMVDPVIKAQGSLAAVRQVLQSLKVVRPK